jgi:VWFA-related protein
MRKLFACVTVLSALVAPSGRAAQETDPSRQVLRAKVDLLTVDVAALDGRGDPVEDLRARDFVVKVDGKTREVVSAELVRVDREPRAAVEDRPFEALVSTNEVVPGGRRVVIGVDQTLIVPGSIATLLRTASGFVDGLTPRDHVALVTFPEPGPRVDFTTDKARVRAAMTGIAGQPAKLTTSTFNAGLVESIAIFENERLFYKLGGSAEQIWLSLGPMTRRVLERGTCEELSGEDLGLIQNTETLVRCLIQLGNEAMLDVLNVRQEANISLRRLESFLRELVAIDGPKSMVLISAGLLVEDLTVLNEVVRLAAASRTSIHVVAVDPERDRSETIRGLPHGQSSLALQDRQLELTGLEEVADRTGGSFVRARAGTGDGIFERLLSELSAWYVVAVERRPDDPERQRVDVEVRRRGVTVRSNRTFVASAAINAKRSGEELLSEAMASPIAIAGVPLRVSTFAQRDAATGEYRLHVAAQIGPPGTQAGEFIVGYVVMNEANQPVASLGRRLMLTPADGTANTPLSFDTALGIGPGTYVLRFGVVDPEGRRGTVNRRIELDRPAGGDLQTSDLIVGTVPAEGEVMHPAVEPRIEDGQVAGYLELYLADGDPGGLTVSLEIAEGHASPALSTQLLNVGAGPQPQWRIASGAVELGVLPGRYVARATIRRNGEALRVLSRPFVLEPGADRRPRPTSGPRSVAISPEMQRRTAAYVESVAGSWRNIVAQEELVLGNRQVTSDFLLVRYPGSDRDLLLYRDVLRVNGVEQSERQERLAELFLKPMSGIRDRAAQIALAAEKYVPPVLNPIFGLAFLQRDFQSRFELTVQDAGPDWPPQVKAVAFVETARPTLLRTGPLGDLDIPTRGTAWVEEGTGRILQTELQVGSGRSATTIVTRFRLDERLQIMVPELMRSENPAGVATYGNFRRFTVQTDAEITPASR